MTMALTLLLGLSVTLVLAASLYLAMLTVVALIPSRVGEGSGPRANRFVIVIPSHDEELNIVPVVEGLLTLDYPEQLVDVVVVADNCSDETAGRARAAGAQVIERVDAERVGKGFALQDSFAELLTWDQRYDAFVVLDADSIVSPNLLSSFDTKLAAGKHVIQAHYAALNPDDNWRTTLMSAALAAVHMLRPVARRRLGLSVGLKGNGMCFSREIIERFGWPAHSIVEDAEFTLTLWEHQLKVDFAREATVSAQMPVGAAEFATQRARWEGGRTALFAQACRRFVPKVLGSRDWVAFDLLAELAIPPLSQLVALTLFLFGTAGGLAWAGQMPWWPAALAALSMSLQVGYVAGALRLVKAPRSTWVALAWAPLFIVWKLWQKLIRASKPGTWIRTGRTRIES